MAIARMCERDVIHKTGST